MSDLQEVIKVESPYLDISSMQTSLSDVFDIVPLVYNDTIDTSVIINVLLIDNSVQEYQQFVDGCNITTFPIVYDYHSDRNELKELLARKFSNIQRIAFVFHNAGMNSKLFLNNQCFFNETPFSENVQFLVDIIRDFGVSHLDYLACNSLEYDNWKHYYEILTTITNVVVGASDDATGNLKYGGDWVMESTNEDIKTVYFNDSIEEYTKTLATSTIAVSTTVTNVNLNNTSLYTWPITINGGSLSSPVVITFGDNITLNSTSKYFIIGSNYVTIDGGNKMVTISGVNNYNGLIQNGTNAANGYSSINIKNINIQSTNSILSNNSGWICQQYFCKGSSNTNIIQNCTNSGTTSVSGGGIIGARFAQSSGGTNNVSNCANSGDISGNYSGGIIGGNIGYTPNFAANPVISVNNCYSIGLVTGGFVQGGICGGNTLSYTVPATVNINNCYTLNGAIRSGAQHSRVTFNVTNTYTSNGVWSFQTALQNLLTQVNSVYIWAYPKVNGIDQINSPFLLYSLNPNNTPVSRLTSTIITFSVPSPKTYGVDTSFTLTDLSSNSQADFSYNSSNTAVATISNGKVTIVGAGNTNISVSQAANSNYTAGYIDASLVVNKVTAILSNFIIPTTISEHTTIQLLPPQSNNLSTAFTYRTSNPNVAIIINDNQLKMIGNGTTTITATQVETNNYLSTSISAQFDTSVIKFPSPTDIQPNKITGTSEPNSTVVVTETTTNNETITTQIQSDAQGIWDFNVTTHSNNYSFAPLNANQFSNSIQSDYNMKYQQSTYSFTVNTPVLIKPRQYGINPLDQRSWRITPKLPEGLKFSYTTGIISGTPTVPTPSTTYAVWSNSEIFLGYRQHITIEIVSPP